MNIIAEFGCNWQDTDTFIKMLRECERIGIKYVKLQLWLKRNVPLEVWKMYISEFIALKFKAISEPYGVELFFTPFYKAAVDICELAGVEYYKIRYLDRNAYDLYQAISKTKKPVFVSCPYYKDTIWRDYEKAYFLYCVPEYPAKYYAYGGVTLDKFDGISDHTATTKLLKEAKKMGFQWFEKHVCLDGNNDYYESKWSVPISYLEGLV